jgi:hypothetical protein
MNEIVFIGLNDYMLRNLLCSSFGPRARQLDWPLHGLVYPDSYPVYREIVKRELGMTTEPQELVRLPDWQLPHLEQLAFRSSLCRSGRVKNHTYKATRRQAWIENRNGLKTRIKLELAFLAGRVGGMLHLDRRLTREYHRGLEKTAYVQEVCVPRLKQLAPTILISASPETFYDVPWLLAAGLLGIPRAVWIRSWDNLTSKIHALPDAEIFFVWSDLMAHELRQYFPEYAHRQTILTGPLQFDGHHDPANVIPREEFCARMGLNPNRSIILYCTGGPHIMTKEYFVIRDLQKVVADMPAHVRPQILVRVHPYSWNSDFRAYESLRDVCLWPREKDAPAMAGGSTTGLIDDYKIMMSSFHHQAVNVNIASTVTLDSVVLDKPVINVAYDGSQRLHPFVSAARSYRYDHYKPVVRSGAVSVAYSLDDLRKYVNQALVHPDGQRQQRQDLVRLECGEVDGRAGERLVDAIVQTARASVKELRQISINSAPKPFHAMSVANHSPKLE